MNRIGTLAESSLHSALKGLYALPGDKIEAPVAGYMVDILREDEIIEIQTGNFTALKPKLEKLLPEYRVRIVVPIAVKRRIMRIANDGSIVSIRKSPRQGRVEDLFYELVRITHYLNHSNLVLEVALVEDEVRWIDDGKGSWRRKRWSIQDRLLVQLYGSQVFTSHESYNKLMPVDLNERFSSREFALAIKLPPRQVSKMLYCLRAMNIVEVVDRQGKAYIYKRIA